MSTQHARHLVIFSSVFVLLMVVPFVEDYIELQVPMTVLALSMLGVFGVLAGLHVRRLQISQQLGEQTSIPERLRISAFSEANRKEFIGGMIFSLVCIIAILSLSGLSQRLLVFTFIVAVLFAHQVYAMLMWSKVYAEVTTTHIVIGEDGGASETIPTEQIVSVRREREWAKFIIQPRHTLVIETLDSAGVTKIHKIPWFGMSSGALLFERTVKARADNS